MITVIMGYVVHDDSDNVDMLSMKYTMAVNYCR